jgi:hypothetical protein
MWGAGPNRQPRVPRSARTDGKKWVRRRDTILKWAGGVFLFLIVLGIIQGNFGPTTSSTTSDPSLPISTTPPAGNLSKSIVRLLAIQSQREIAKETPGEGHLPILVRCDRHPGTQTGSLIVCSVYTVVDKNPVISGFTYTSADLPVGTTSYTYTPPAG